MAKKIAIIDDDHVIQESLQEFLADAGYAVSSAADGASGYDLIARDKPDLVLADILLPRLHGIALCEKIRANEAFKGMAIILMTGVYKDVNLRMYVHKGLAEDFIEKPFRDKDLLAKIERFIGPGAERDLVQPPAREAENAHPRKPSRSLASELDDLVSWAHGKKK